MAWRTSPQVMRESARARASAAAEAGRVLSRRFLRRAKREAADQPFLFELIERQASSGPGRTSFASSCEPTTRRAGQPELSHNPRRVVQQHPVRLVVDDDLKRSRLTVFFRLLLALPHYVWAFVWSLLMVVVAIVNWFATLILGRSPAALHNLTAAYVRYLTHLFAYLLLAANPYPLFIGTERYPVDLEVDEPAPQRRLVTFFRLPLALPVLVFAAVFLATYAGGSYSSSGRQRRRLQRRRDLVERRDPLDGRALRLVRVPGARPDADGLPEPPGLRAPLRRAGRGRTCSCSPTAIRTSIPVDPPSTGPAPSGRARGHGRPQALAADGLLPLPARAAALRLADPVGRRRLPRRRSPAGSPRSSSGGFRARCTASSPLTCATRRTSSRSCS